MKTGLTIILSLVIYQILTAQTAVHTHIEGPANDYRKPVVLIEGKSTAIYPKATFEVLDTINDRGVAGKFIGGRGGVTSFGDYYGVWATADGPAGYGLRAYSYNYHSSLFSCDDGYAHIVLSGSNYFGNSDDGVIMTDPGMGGSDLALVSNDDVVIQLDQNEDEDGYFKIVDGPKFGTEVMTVSDQGNLFSKQISVNTSSLAGDMVIKQSLDPFVQAGSLSTATPVGLRLEHTNGSLNSMTLFMDDDAHLYLAFNNTLRGQWNRQTGVYSTLSDRRAKTNIQYMDSQLDRILKLAPATYAMKDDEVQRSQIGVIAQDVLEIYPELVHESNGRYSVSYSELGVLAIQAVKEQQDKINALEQMIKSLQSEILAMKGTDAE